MRTDDGLLIVAPDEGTPLDRIVHKVQAAETGGRWGVAIVEGERGSSGWTHIHQGEPEGFFLLDGEVEVCGAESVTRIGPGTFVVVPADTHHALRVLSDKAKWLAIWPSSLDGLLDELAQARAEGRGDPQTEAAIRARHGTVPGRPIKPSDRPT